MSVEHLAWKWFAAIMQIAVGQRNLMYGLMASVEEILEMVGVIVFIYALLSYIGSSLENIDFRLKIVENQER